LTIDEAALLPQVVCELLRSPDFTFKIGGLMALLTWIITTWLAPKVWPFR
jgi:hypothetical protein